MNQYKKYQKQMLKQYISWLNSDTFTKEVAAFEYMKRNPYFISVASLYKLNLKYNNISQSRKIKQLLQQIFLYTGFDMDGIKKDSGGYTLLERYKDTNFKNFDGLMADYHYTGENYYYSGIYKADQLQYYSDIDDEYIKESKSALDAKKEYPIDLNFFHNNGKSLRWLDYLLPSMYIKINPYLKQDDLKSALVNLIKQISADEAIPNTEWKLLEYVSPDILLDINQDGNVSLQAPTFQSLKSLVALIMYDFIYIYKETDPKRIKKILRLCVYPHISYKIKNEFEKYFNYSGEATNYENVKFNFQHKKKNISNVYSRIHSKYLDYIYPYKSKRLHQRLLLKEYKDIYSKENITQDKKVIMNVQNILNPHRDVYKQAHTLENYMGIIQVNCFTTKEYEKWSNDVFSLLKNENYCDSIFSILFL